jgi:hypothetical protein
MCLNCGCGLIDERHGNDANIVADDVRRAAATNRQNVGQTVRNIEDALRRVGRDEPATAGVGRGSGMALEMPGDRMKSDRSES